MTYWLPEIVRAVCLSLGSRISPQLEMCSLPSQLQLDFETVKTELENLTLPFLGPFSPDG